MAEKSYQPARRARASAETTKSVEADKTALGENVVKRCRYAILFCESLALANLRTAGVEELATFGKTIGGSAA
jgi:hypothetical protein